MAILFDTTKDQKLITAVNTLSECGGGSKWAAAYNIELPAAGSLSSDNRMIAFQRQKNGAPFDGFQLWHYDPASWAGIRAQINFEPVMVNFTAPALDAYFNSGFHLWHYMNDGAGNIELYVDGVLIESVASAQTIPIVITASCEWGSQHWLSTRAPSGAQHGMSLYKDQPYSNADFAMNLFESQNKDVLRSGLVGRWRLSGGVNGATVTGENDISGFGNDIITVSGSPDLPIYQDAPLN